VPSVRKTSQELNGLEALSDPRPFRRASATFRTELNPRHSIWPYASCWQYTERYILVNSRLPSHQSTPGPAGLNVRDKATKETFGADRGKNHCRRRVGYRPQGFVSAHGGLMEPRRTKWT